MFKFKKWFGAKTKDSELPKEEHVEVTLSEQEEDKPVDPSYELPSINEDQVSISATTVSPADGALIVGFFVSNGLIQKVKFDTVPLVLIDSEKRVLARQSFEGDSIGEIASGSAKACVVRFDQNNVYVKDVPLDCQVCFDVPAKQTEGIRIDYQFLPENISEDQQQELERALAGLPPIKPGEVNFSPLHAQITPQSELLATVIIRNATDKIIRLEQIPLALFDAQHVELTRAQFDIENLTIEPLKAITWAFNFGTISQAEAIDLSSWYINVVQ
ncbi:MAG: hypothetical protein APF81_08870 [Desulfosporosinus sp. BRH_c37]|nr:MAG: hypothetical protein APF81_08870 [Desulfosporosinus sp. BRH_c37]